jgi:hypothetical protein
MAPSRKMKTPKAFNMTAQGIALWFASRQQVKAL